VTILERISKKAQGPGSVNSFVALDQPTLEDHAIAHAPSEALDYPDASSES